MNIQEEYTGRDRDQRSLRARSPNMDSLECKQTINSDEKSEIIIQCSDQYKSLLKYFFKGEAVMKTQEQLTIKVNTDTTRNATRDTPVYYIEIMFDMYFRVKSNGATAPDSVIRETECVITSVKTNFESDFIFWMCITAYHTTCTTSIAELCLKKKLLKSSKKSIIDAIVYSPTDGHPTFKLECTPGRKMSLLNI